MKKRVLAVILGAVMTMSLAACGSSDAGRLLLMMEKRLIRSEFPSLQSMVLLIIAVRDFLEGLKEEGIEEGKNLTVEVKNAAADQGTAKQISDGFVSDKVDLVCAIATPSAQAAYNSAMNSDIPVVYTAVTDPVAAKLAKEDGTPAGNVTGTSDELPIKAQLEMIREMLPDAKNIGILFTQQAKQTLYPLLQNIKSLPETMDFTIVDKGIAQTADISLATDELLTEVDCLTNLTDNTVVASLATILDKANKQNIPVFGSEIEQVKIGCLAAEGIDYVALGKQTGKMAAEILKGEKKAPEMNFETITEPGFYVNEKVAENLGVTVPQDLADEAVESFTEITK